MGLQAIERIEMMAAELAAEVFDAPVRRGARGLGRAGQPVRLHGLLPPGDTIIAPPADIGGHVTHHAAGAAGPVRAEDVPAPVHADGYTVDVDALRTRLAHEVRPRLITLGGSLNLFPHPVAAVRGIADEVGAR
jgi:glycine hydroxymethyltransferase